jgi:LmbE family N-acetylglucosaminyl deacetylase
MRCQAEGGRAVLVTATLGQRGKAGDPPICTPEELEARREDELRTAARIIGFSDLHLLGYQDRELADAPIADVRRSLVAILRHHRPSVVLTFAMDGIAAAADPRWHPADGPAHTVARVLWTPPIAPWEAARLIELAAAPGVDFAVDVSAWRERRAAALRAHRTQHLSTERYFFSQPDVDHILGLEVYRQGSGPALHRRPQDDVFDGI